MNAKDLCVEKKSFLVVDSINSQKIYAYKVKEKRYPASLTKIMTAYLLFEAIKNKKITLNTLFTVSKLATKQIPSKIN
ncbi:MAG: hypothetical protein LBF70_02490, partial [Holosporales bacterium]|nr:hypothetical protein [Holosporales bacterium]